MGVIPIPVHVAALSGIIDMSYETHEIDGCSQDHGRLGKVNPCSYYIGDKWREPGTVLVIGVSQPQDGSRWVRVKVAINPHGWNNVKNEAGEFYKPVDAAGSTMYENW